MTLGTILLIILILMLIESFLLGHIAGDGVMDPAVGSG